MLDRIGPLLFGKEYKIPLARALGVDARTLRRWILDGYCPEDKLRDLYELLRRRDVASAAVRHDLMREIYGDE